MALGGKGGPGTHSGRGTLTPAGSPLPFPCTAAPASPGPAPASVCRAADTRPSAGLARRTMGFSLHRHHWPKLLSHDYSHSGMFIQRCTFERPHTLDLTHGGFSLLGMMSDQSFVLDKHKHFNRHCDSLWGIFFNQ